MGIAEEIALFEEKLNELVRKYEQYFLGLEKREPLKLLEDVDKRCRHFAGVPIVNTMVKFRYNSIAARLNSYKQYWGRINRQIEEGKYSRDRFRMQIHEQSTRSESQAHALAANHEIDAVFQQFMEARRACNLQSDGMTPEMLTVTLEKQRALLEKKHNCTEIEFRVVIEDGKPKIKARPKK
jgi:hypothetical protein